MMKRAAQTKQYAELDHAIKTKVEPYLYNKGQGRLIPVSRLVLLRNKERPRHKMVIGKAIPHKFVKHNHVYFCLSTCFDLHHRPSSDHYNKNFKNNAKCSTIIFHSVGSHMCYNSHYLLTYLLHRAESFLRSQLILQLLKKFPEFLEPESSSPYSQVPPTSPYPEPTQSSPHNPLPLTEDPS